MLRARADLLATTVAASTSLFTQGQPTDLVDLASCKTALQINETADDAYLQTLISDLSTQANNFCGRVLVPQSYRDTFFPARPPFPGVFPDREAPLQLSRWPLTVKQCYAGIAPALAPTLSFTPGGAAGAQGYYVKITYVTAFGETPASLESFILVPANNVLNVASPAKDSGGLATGWNVYVATSSYAEVLQNASPIAIGSNWIYPGALSSLGALPNFVGVVDKWNYMPTPLCEGVDFLVDPRLGQLTRLHSTTGHPRDWGEGPAVVEYQAGFNPVPADVQGAMRRLVKTQWFDRLVNPRIRTKEVMGVSSTTYWFGSGPGADAAENFPPDVRAILDNYRAPVVG